MEPDAKVDNDIAMTMMIKKRTEQTPLMIPNYTSFVGEGRVTGLRPWWSAELRRKDDGTLSTMPGTT